MLKLFELFSWNEIISPPCQFYSDEILAYPVISYLIRNKNRAGEFQANSG